VEKQEEHFGAGFLLMFLNIMDLGYFSISCAVKRKKLFYVPGLISLIGLPILVFYLFPKEQKQLTVIRIFLPSDRKSKDENIIRYSRDRVFKTIGSKKIFDVNLNPQFPLRDEGKTDSLYEFLSEKLGKFKLTNDTTIVIKVDFGNSNTYGQVVWLLNQTLIHQLKRWAYIDNSFYFINNSIDSPIIKYLEL
jgi:hypothetical protein